MSEPTSQYFAQPLEDNLFEWHFTVRGQDDSDYEGGIYHGRIVLPSEYPMKPPNIIILTVCLDVGFLIFMKLAYLHVQRRRLTCFAFVQCHANFIFSRTDVSKWGRKSASQSRATTPSPGSRHGPSGRPCWPSSGSCQLRARAPSDPWNILPRRGKSWRVLREISFVTAAARPRGC